MAPPRKVPPGSATRSVLLRADQIAALDAAAVLFGVDLSDVVRGAIDLLSPPDPREEWTRVRAAFELRRRELGRRPSAVRNELELAILDGFRGEEPRLSLRAAGRGSANLVAGMVAMLRRLSPPVPIEPAGPDWAREQWAEFARDWASRADAGLMALLACPAVRCLGFGKKSPVPQVVAVASAVGGIDAAPRERQYEGPARAAADLVSAGILTPTAPASCPPESTLFTGRTYSIVEPRPGRR